MSTKHVLLMTGTKRRTVTWRADNGFGLSVRLEPGLYTLGVQTDMRRFDWERLWRPMTKFRNRGQRTGPWDFDLYNENVPLLPTWRVHFDGRCVGLWYLQHPTVEDLDRKRLRAEFGFRVDVAREVAIECVPYNTFELDPIAMYVEPSAFDRLVEQPWAARGIEANWAANLDWPALRAKVRGTEWEQFLRAAVSDCIERFAARTEADRRPSAPPDALAVLAFAWRLLDDENALSYARTFVEELLAQPAWGNPNPDGYGHNGDMGCAGAIKYLTLACNWLGDELGALAPAALDRIVAQMETFLDQQLLMAHYWGGAILQDHGFRSSAMAAFASLCLLGHTDKAAQWLSFYVPRIHRTLRILPRDGFIPFSSYHRLDLYTNDVTDLRVALKHASGEDIFDRPCYRQVPRYQLACLDEQSMNTFVSTPRGDRKAVTGGLPFLLAMARDHGCERAGYLAHLLVQRYRAAQRSHGPHATLPMSIVLFDARALNPVRPATRALEYFEDGGAINYRNEARRFNVSINCFPIAGSFHAIGTDLSGTDLMLSNPSSGHFSVAVGREPLIQNAESGYRTGSFLGNVPLIDGRGQYGDNGYTMGVPMRRWGGQRIQTCRADAAPATGFARIDLTPAYADDLNVMTCTRDFRFAPGALRVRDTIVCLEPRVFSWWFNTYARHTISPLGPNAFRIAQGDAAVSLRIEGDGLATEIKPTDVVWAYVNENENQDFVHVEVTHPTPVRELVVDFIVSLD